METEKKKAQVWANLEANSWRLMVSVFHSGVIFYEGYIYNVTVSYKSHLFMNSGNSDYIRFHINDDAPREYQILITFT